MRARGWILATWLLLGGMAAVAQTTSGCPVSVTDVRNLDTRIFVLFSNASGKQITEYHFGLEFYGVDGSVHPYPETFTGRARVPAHGRFVAYWKSAYTLQYLHPRAKAYLLDATFSDGTSWGDDGSHSCGKTAVEE